MKAHHEQSVIESCVGCHPAVQLIRVGNKIESQISPKCKNCIERSQDDKPKK